MKKIAVILILMAAIFLGGCDDSKVADLKAKEKSEKSEEQKRIDKLWEYDPNETNPNDNKTY